MVRSLLLIIWAVTLVACSQADPQNGDVGGARFVATDANLDEIVNAYHLSFEDWWTKYRASGGRAAVANPGDGASGTAPGTGTGSGANTNLAATEAQFQTRTVCQEFKDAPQLVGTGSQAGSAQTLQSWISQFPSNAVTDPALLTWINDGAKGTPPTGNINAPRPSPATCEEATKATEYTARKVGPVVGGGGPCMPPFFPCSLQGAGGCCRRCLAPRCFAQYANGAFCAGWNNPFGPWFFCTFPPAGWVVAWVCPCLN